MFTLSKLVSRKQKLSYIMYEFPVFFFKPAVLLQIYGQTVAEFVNKLQCNLHPGYQPLLKYGL